MPTSGSTYPGRDLPTTRGYKVSGGVQLSTPSDDPSIRSASVLAMMPHWDPINICLGGTKLLRTRAEDIVPREPREDDDAYNRRIFHLTMPPFLQRLASQAAGTILRKGITLEGDPYWDEWRNDVTGDGTTLNGYARRLLIDALLYGHSSTLVDYSATTPALSLADQRLAGDRPYLVPVDAQQILGWRTSDNRAQSALTQVRILERVIEPDGTFGEDVIDQVRVLTPGGYEVWRLEDGAGLAGGWRVTDSGPLSVSGIPLVTVYSNRLGTLLSRPPLIECAYLNIAFAQRFCDYHHSIHVGASPILVLRGFDPDSDSPVGLSVNTAVLLPPDGGAEYVEPTSDCYTAQLQCLKALEDQISRLGINTLAQQNITNAAAEAKRLDRIDSDSIMAVISEDLERAITDIITLASEYVGIEPPTVSIPKDYENRLIDGNQITAYLQLFMQGAISQETLLDILQQGEVLPPNVDLDEEVIRTRDYLEAQQAADAGGMDMAFQSPGEAATPSLSNATLPTPLRPDRSRGV
jgi:hypothetical protein